MREAIERYKKGELSPTRQPSVPDHFGMGGGQGSYPGRGMGRGMGMQGGFAPPQAPPPPLSSDQELKALKEDAKALLFFWKRVKRCYDLFFTIHDIEKENTP